MARKCNGCSTVGAVLVPFSFGTALTTNVIALIQSCSYHASTHQSRHESGRPGIWAQLLGSNSMIHIKFSEPRKLSFEAPSNHGREDYFVDEILVGLPEGRWAGPLLARTGRNVHPFGKYTRGHSSESLLNGPWSGRRCRLTLIWPGLMTRRDEMIQRRSRAASRPYQSKVQPFSHCPRALAHQEHLASRRLGDKTRGIVGAAGSFVFRDLRPGE